MGKGELNPFLMYILFTLLGTTFENLRFFYSFSLLSVVSLNQTLNNIAKSLDNVIYYRIIICPCRMGFLFPKR